MPSKQHHRETSRQRLSIYNIYTTICQKTLDIGVQRYFSIYIELDELNELYRLDKYSYPQLKLELV